MTQHQNTELLPCPVCKHDKALVFKEVYGPMNGLSYVKCQDCNWRSCYCDTNELAINEWNNRSPAKAVQGDNRQIADITNAIREGILKTWPEFKPDIGRLRTVVSVALTPESEGIAGKGDVDRWPDVVAAQRMDIENGYWILIADESIIAENLDESGAKYLEKCVRHYRLTRPQEIDVEAIEAEITDFWYKQPAGFPTSPIGAITAAVSYLAASGRLK